MSEHRAPLDRKSRRGWYFLLFLAFVALALIGIWALWSGGSNRRLEGQVALYKAAGEPIELADFRDPPIENDDDNAAVILRDAAKIDFRTKAWEAYDKLNLDGLPLREKEIERIRAVIAANPGAFDNVDAAMKCKGVDWQLGIRSPAISVLLPDLNEQRMLAFLIANRAMLRAQQGDHAGALADLVRVDFIARAVDRQPFLVGHLVANGIRGIVSERAQLMAPELKIGSKPGEVSPQQMADFIAALLEDKAQRDAQHRAMQGERMFQLDTVRCLADGRMNLSQVGGFGTGGAGRPGPAAALAAAGIALKPMMLQDGLIMMRHTTAIIAALDASPDWRTFKAKAPAFPADVENSPYSHLLARMLLPAFDRSIETDFRVTADRRMAATALAVRGYALDHGGKRAQKLDDLVPRYLPSVPADSLAMKQPLKYIPDPTRPIVYSVGENGGDDGGSEAPINPNARIKNPGRWQQRDAVVHLTRQQRPPPEPDDDAADNESTTQPTTAPTTAPGND